jgi:hypothetical protein
MKPPVCRAFVSRDFQKEQRCEIRTYSTAEIDPGSRLARGLRIRVQVIRVQAHGGDHDAKHIQTPEKRRDHVMITIFEAEAQPDQAGQDERRGNPHRAQAHLGLEMPLMLADVAARDEIVQPVACDLAQQGRDNGREVEIPDLERAEVVQWGQEDGERGVDPDHPGKSEQIVHARQEDGGFERDFDGSQARLAEGVAEVAGFPLREADKACEVRAAVRLGGWSDAAVVVGFFGEKDDQDEAESGLGETSVSLRRKRGDGPF